MWRLIFTSIILHIIWCQFGIRIPKLYPSRYVFYLKTFERQLNSLIIELNLLLPMQECFLTDTVDIEYGELLPNNIEEPVL